jgi:hypothetical protein
VLIDCRQSESGDPLTRKVRQDSSLMPSPLMSILLESEKSIPAAAAALNDDVASGAIVLFQVDGSRQLHTAGSIDIEQGLTPGS